MSKSKKITRYLRDCGIRHFAIDNRLIDIRVGYITKDVIDIAAHRAAKFEIQPLPPFSFV